MQASISNLTASVFPSAAATCRVVWESSSFCSTSMADRANLHKAETAPLYAANKSCFRLPLLPSVGLTSEYSAAGCHSCGNYRDTDFWQKLMPLWLFPSLSNGGERHIIPMALGTTRRMASDTAELAADPHRRQANWPEKSFMPQECMRLRVLCTVSALRTLLPVMGQMSPLRG